MKPSNYSYRHGRVSVMDTLIIVVIISVVLAAIWHAKTQSDERKQFIKDKMTDNSRLVP